MDQEPWTAERVREMMTNPIYCLTEPAIVAEDVWIGAGVKLIREIGERNICRWCSQISARHLRSRSAPDDECKAVHSFGDEPLQFTTRYFSSFGLR